MNFVGFVDTSFRKSDRL